MSQLHGGSGAEGGLWDNQAAVNTEGQLHVNPAYYYSQTIRTSAGSPATWYSFGNRAETILIDNLGTTPIYFAFGASGVDPANSGTAFLASGTAISMDLRVGSVSIQGSGTSTPQFQLIGLR